MTWSNITTQTEEPEFETDTCDRERCLSYAHAVREGVEQALAMDPNVFVMGQGVDDVNGMFGTTKDLQDLFGRERVFDTPLAENAMTGVAIGAAMGGMRPIHFHNRPDFLLLAMDQIVNHAAKWSYMFGGEVNVPLVIWACTGRGWGSAAQHSQALQGLFLHVPGLKLVMPSTCHDAKGLMLAAVKDNNPVLILDHRYNFKQKGPVPADTYTVPLGKGIVRKRGKDVTVVAVSHLVLEAYKAAQELAEEDIDVEIVDPRTLCPLDHEIILTSVAKTGRLVIADTGCKTGGITAEISAIVAERVIDRLTAPIRRVACPDVPAPAGPTLEAAYYVGKSEIKDAVRKLFVR